MSTVDNERRTSTPRVSRREALRREIRRNEEQMFSLIEPTSLARLVLEQRGARRHLPDNVLRADRRGATVLTDRLTTILQSRGSARTFGELVRYNREVQRTIALFQIYQRFQVWQAEQLPTVNRPENQPERQPED